MPRTLTIIACLLLAACASLQQPEPDTLDCAGLAQAVADTSLELGRERTNLRAPVTLNIGLGGAVGSHGGIGVGFGLPIGTPRVDEDRIHALEEKLARLQSLQRQRQCPPTTANRP